MGQCCLALDFLRFPVLSTVRGLLERAQLRTAFQPLLIIVLSRRGRTWAAGF